MPGRSLLPLFFFFWVAVTDPRVGLEWLLEEALSVIENWGFCELPWQLNSSWLKYSISFIIRDPTVPLVPISTGVCAISSGTFVAMVLDLYMFCLVGVKETCGWREEALRGLVLVRKLLWVWFICFCFVPGVSHELFTSCSLSKVKGIRFLPGRRIGWWYGHCIHVLAVKTFKLLTTVPFSNYLTSFKCLLYTSVITWILISIW